MGKRLRRKALGVVALGYREKKYGAAFTWVFGTPSARPVKDGVKWVLRTPKRLIEAGLPWEFNVGVDAEADVKALNADLTASFSRALKDFATRSKACEVKCLKVLPGSEIMRLIRRRRSRKIPNLRLLPFMVKCEDGLAEVTLVHDRRRYVHAKLKKLKGLKASQVKPPFLEFAVKANAEWLMTAPDKEVVPIVKAELEKRGFKILLCGRVRKGRRKAKGRVKQGVRWVYTAHLGISPSLPATFSTLEAGKRLSGGLCLICCGPPLRDAATY